MALPQPLAKPDDGAMEHEIVVGYDGSESSRAAVDWAVDAARLRSSSVRIIACLEVPFTTCIAPLSYDALAGIASATEESAMSVLRQVRQRHPLLDVFVDVLDGPATSVLQRESKDADIVVVGASGHHGAAALWLGSTARWLARHSTCPVAVIRSETSTGAGSETSYEPPRHDRSQTALPLRTGRVLVGTDGSSASDEAVLWAADEADRRGVELIVVHGWSFTYRPVDLGSAQARDFTHLDAAELLDRSVELARERCGVSVTGVLREADRTTALTALATPGDIVVLGSPHHGQVTSTLIGSTVNGVIERSSVPVIIVPPTMPI